MKWRVELPDPYEGKRRITDIPTYPLPDPDIVEATELVLNGDCLVFRDFIFGTPVPSKTRAIDVTSGDWYTVKAYAPGQWVTVERVEDGE